METYIIKHGKVILRTMVLFIPDENSKHIQIAIDMNEITPDDASELLVFFENMYKDIRDCLREIKGSNYSLYSRRVEFRLSEKELDVLNKMTTNGGVSKSVLVRDLLNKATHK